MHSPSLALTSRLLFTLVIASGSAAPFAADSTLPRTLLQEPQYESTPKYCVMVLGNSGKANVWMVEDGKRLFVDRNANGDLTDDGPPIMPSDMRTLGDKRWDFNYIIDAITPGDGSRHTQFDLRRWNYGEKEDSYGLSLHVDGQIPMFAGWFGTFWSANRETAPVIHFGGAFHPVLLRATSFAIGAGPQRLSLGFITSGSGRGAESRLSIEAVLPHVMPKVNIEWPAAGGGAPLRTSHKLMERCCYWDFYTTTFEVPAGAAVGKAKASIEFPEGTMPVKLKTTEFELKVEASR